MGSLAQDKNTLDRVQSITICGYKKPFALEFYLVNMIGFICISCIQSKFLVNLCTVHLHIVYIVYT